MACSANFLHTWDYWLYEEYTAPDCRCFSNLMSGRWAFQKAVSNVLLKPPGFEA